MSAPKTIKIKYACVDGMHFFTSGDAYSLGMCAGSESLKTAYDEAHHQLHYLLKKNHQIQNVKYKSKVPLEKLEEWLAKGARV